MDDRLSHSLQEAWESLAHPATERLAGAAREQLLLLATNLALEAQREAEASRQAWAIPRRLKHLGRRTGLRIPKLWVS